MTIFFIPVSGRLSLTTIDHFVALKGRDACDIIIRKITTSDQFYTGLQPTSLYNIEYTPKLIARKTTAYANTRERLLGKKINSYNKIIINNFMLEIR